MARWGVLGLLLFPLTINSQALLLQDTFHFPVEPTFSTGGSDVWGYVDSSGTKYCLMGTLTGISVVDITHGRVVQTVPGPISGDGWYHRDIETYGQYAYIASELRGNREGVMILDLSTLPDSVRFVGSYIPPQGYVTAHNLFVDTVTGYMYIVRSSDGVEVVSLADPEQPLSLGLLPDTIPIQLGLYHDVFARGDTLLVADGLNHSFSIWDMSDKQNPLLVHRVVIPETSFVPDPYVHTVWMADSVPLVFVGNEDYDYITPLKVYGLFPGDSIALLDTFYGSFAIPHNVYTLGTLVFIAGYQYGVVVADYSQPGHVQELARYDTYPANENPYDGGAWGVYAFPDSTICVSNENDILFVLKYDATIQREEPTSPEQGPHLPTLLTWDLTSPLSLHVPASGSWRAVLLDPLGRSSSLPVRKVSPQVISLNPRPIPSGHYLLRLTNKRQQVLYPLFILKTRRSF